MTDQILPLRLPPSGSLVLDALSQQPLMLGDGTPGLVWHSQFSSSAPIDIGGAYATPVAVSGLGGPVTMRAGYSYDLEFSLTLGTTAGSAGNNVIVLLEGSTDNGLTWTQALGTAAWAGTISLASESATYSDGTMRVVPTADITNIRLRAGASGSAGERVVTDGFLRVEQYVLGDEPEVFRLNPSGGFLEDASTNMPAQAGSGMPGLIWRARAVPAHLPINVGGSVPQLIGDLTNAWSLPAGYRYDVKLSVGMANGAPTDVGDLQLLVEQSSDGGATYSAIINRTLANTTLGSGEAREYFAARMSYIPTADITNIRCSAAGGVAGRAITGAWLKIEQYVS